MKIKTVKVNVTKTVVTGNMYICDSKEIAGFSITLNETFRTDDNAVSQAEKVLSENQKTKVRILDNKVSKVKVTLEAPIDKFLEIATETVTE